jgi:pre-mRNA-splicing helicase BRR2
MEPHLREHQFDYRETKGRVIQMEGARSKSKAEPSGEAESLKGKILKMGDKTSYSLPPASLKNEFRLKPKPLPKIATGSLLYHPKTNETRSIYEQMLSMTQNFFGDSPDEIVKEALDQILATLKLEEVQEIDKKSEIEAILGKIDESVFSKLLAMSKLLIDYSGKKEENQETEEMVVDLEKEDQDAVEDQDENMDQVGFNLKDLDADWLSRQLSSFINENLSTKESQVLEILQIDDLRRCETRLVMCLGFQNFDLITVLLSHKFEIFHCLKFFKSSSSEEKQAILQELSQTTHGQALVDFLVPNTTSSLAPPKRVLDLSCLHFDPGSTSRKVSLPGNHSKEVKPGYEEIVIPAGISRVQSKTLLHQDLPDFCKAAFTVKALNEVQTQVFPAAFESDENLLICAPTGAGKTNISLMTILRELQKCVKNDGEIDLAHVKIVYVAPMKALVSEVCGNLAFRLEKYGVCVKELTGDSSLSKGQIQNTQVIVTTPEKWDIVTRKSGDRTFTDWLRLVIIDEVHLLHDPRGPVIEAIVARTLKLSAARSQKIRIVGLSATLPNYLDVAQFLEVKQDGVFYFDRTYRPVPLTQKFIGITETKAIKRFLLMNEICYEKVLENAGKHQVLIFVHSRKETIKTAKYLRDLSIQKQEQSRFVKDHSHSKELLTQTSESIENPDVKDLMPSGFCVHHAGLSKDDRKLVEDLFADKHIQVLVSTATLAWGVNMPAHTVIIKGTQVYSPEKGAWVEISPQDMLQMIGRAGRVDFDTEGEGVIITSSSKLQYYLSLLNQQLPIESQLISALPDLINAEVVLGNLATLKDCVDWIKSTYYPIRACKNRSGYGNAAYEDFEQFLVDLVHSAAVVLDRHGLVKYDKKLGILTQTSLGQIASNYYIKPESISTYNELLKPFMGPVDLLKVFGLSQEFKYIPVREEEKQEIAKLMEKVPYPIKGSMDEGSSKMNILLQCFISKLKLEGFTLMADMVYISQSAARIMRALFEICCKKSWLSLALTSLNLYKMIIHRMWTVMSPLRQFNLLPDDLILKLEKKEGLGWELYHDLTVQQLTELLKLPSKAAMVYDLIRKFPRLALNAFVQPITRSSLKVELSIQKDFEWDQAIHGNFQLFWIFVEDVDSEVILHHEQFVLKLKHSELEHLIVFVVPLFDPLPPQYFIRVVSDKWIASESLLPVSFRHLILPEKPFPYNEPEAVLVKTPAFKWPDAVELLGGDTLTLLESQTFEVAFKSSESFLYAAPDGQFIVGLMTVLKFLSDKSGKAVYLTQLGESAALVYSKLLKIQQFAQGICLTTGHLQVDLKLLNDNQIVVTCAEHFEVLTRRWRQRKAVQIIDLLVVDQLHLLAESGSFLEVAVSRMRFAMTQLEGQMRIVGLASCLTNAHDLAEWLGSKHIFSFPPQMRSVPLSLILETFEQNYRKSRLLAMSKPAYAAIKSYAPKDPVVIFVPDRKVAKKLSLDLILHSSSEGVTFYSQGALGSKEKLLNHAYQHGIAIIGDDSFEMIKSFNAGTVQIAILPSSLMWTYEINARLVLVMDSCRYNGKEHRFQDYSVSEMFQMLSAATKSPSTAMILCHSSKKSFFKTFLNESCPVESSLDHCLEDHYNSEIVSKTINSMQDAVDWLTWTFMYRRLTQNPNYYNLQGTSGAHINDHLSELVENTFDTLEKMKFIETDEFEVQSTNLALITSHYNVKCGTSDMFSNSLQPGCKIKSLLEILVASVELENFPIRPSEEKVLKEINACLPDPYEKAYFNTPSSKCLLLISAHFSRLSLTPELTSDTLLLLKKIPVLISALADISANHGWLWPAIYSITLLQMVTQALWDKDSSLLQLPHFTEDLVEKCKENGVEDIIDLMNLEDDFRLNLLKLEKSQLSQIAATCNAYPSVSMKFLEKIEAVSGELVTIEIQFEREGDYQDVRSSFFPFEKEEQWWVFIGAPKSNKLFGVKKVKIMKESCIGISFLAPDPGNHDLMIYLLCDSYLGVDQGEKFLLTVFA